jgi:hypothetical protein
VAKARPGATFVVGFSTPELVETLARSGIDCPRSRPVALIFGPNTLEVVSTKGPTSLIVVNWTDVTAAVVGRRRFPHRRMPTAQIDLSGGTRLAIVPAPVSWHSNLAVTREIAIRTVQSLEALRVAAEDVDRSPAIPE